MPLHEADLTELIELARRRGSVSMEDVRRLLPLDNMTLEEILHVVARLDEAGFDLDVDPALLLPRSDTDESSDTKREEAELPETLPEEKQQPTSFPAPVVAFTIVVLAVFAFAFWIR